MVRFIFCASVLPVFTAFCLAEDQKPQSADAAIEKVVANSMEASRKTDWKKYADLVHPDSLEEYKKMWLPVLQKATREQLEKQADLLTAFDKAKDLQAVISLSPKDFFISSMKGMAAQIPKPSFNPLNVNEKIIGTVHDDNDHAYVVVRATRKFGSSEMTKAEVVTLRRSGAEWKIMLPDVVRIMAETLQRMAPNADSTTKQDRPKPDK